MTQCTQKVNHAYLYNLANIPKTWYNSTDDKKFSDISVKRALNWLKLGWFFHHFMLIVPVIILVYTQKGITVGDFFLIQGMFRLAMAPHYI